MPCYSYELGSRKVLVYIFLLFLALTRSGFALATEIAMNFFPSHVRTAFCHHLLSKSQSYAKSCSIFGWMFRANSQPQLPGGGCNKPDGICISTAAAPGAGSSLCLWQRQPVSCSAGSSPCLLYKCRQL